MIGWEQSFEPRRRSRRPWLRDTVIASAIGVVIGASIGFRIGDGRWTYSFGIGFIAFTLHAMILGLGQLTRGTRLPRRDLLIVVRVSLVVTAISAVVSWIITVSGSA